MLDAANPFSAPSTLPYALPDWSRITTDDYLPAMRAGMDEQRQEISAITRVRSMPTFENTIEAWERSGALLDRSTAAFFTVSSADATPAMQEIEETIAPELSAHHDAIILDRPLYDRVSMLHARRADLGLTDQQRYLLERRHREMTAAGAGLDEDAKGRLTEINTRLSELTTQFEKHLLADTNDLAVHITDEAELDGLSPDQRGALRAAAEERGLTGWLITLPIFTGHPVLARLRDRALRERVMDASRSRAARDNADANAPVLLEIVRLRAERAAILGHPSHAAAVTAEETAGDPQAVRDLLFRLAPAAARNVDREAAALQAVADADGVQIAAHDWAFYTERVRAAEHDLDTAALRDWFEAERVLQDGVFAAATKLYGVTFTERTDLAGYHPDVRVFEVFEEDGTALGLYLLDLYTRDTKRGGAWMNSIVVQSELLGTAPVVVNNLNVSKPDSGPTLLTLDEAGTLFHEFGHALHGLFAHVDYPHVGGTNVFRDFVEFPSQVNEMWLLHPEILPAYARHHETDEPLAPAIGERLRATGTFNQGFATSEYLAAAWLDFAWHSLTADDANAVTDVAAFQTAALAEIGLDLPLVPPRYGSTMFAHVFAGGYSAGYYSYIWSEVLDADTVDWFEEHGGLTRENGQHFRDRLLAAAGRRDALEAYRDFRGRDADIAPLLARRGLAD